MRIVAGEKRGFKLKTLKGFEVRPTLEQVKESIFNMLAHEIPDSIVVDMFCGSGNLGLEALSRGAKKCYFIDLSKDSLKVTRENVHHLEYDEKAELLRLKLPDALGRFAELKTADLVFADPPYGSDLGTKVLGAVSRDNLAGKDTILVVEHSGKNKVKWDQRYFELLKEKKFGQTDVIILRKK